MVKLLGEKSKILLDKPIIMLIIISRYPERRLKMARPKGTKKQGQRNYLTGGEIKGFFTEARKAKSARDDCLFSLILYLGLRVSEAIRLKLSDLNQDSLEIRIQGLKSGRARTYEIPSDIWKKIGRWLKVRSQKKNIEKNPYLFPSQWYYDKSLTAQSVKDLFKKYAKQAGINGSFSIHSLRHSMGIRLAEEGWSPIQISRWLRHRSTSSTEVYFEQVSLRQDDEKAKRIMGDFF